MHHKTIYQWDNNDPLPMNTRLEEAFNRVISFCPELLANEDRPRELVAFNRVTRNGDFDQSDLDVLREYANVIKTRVDTKYAATSWPPGDEFSQSVRQAVDNLVETVEDTVRYVKETP